MGGDLCENTRADLHDVSDGTIRTAGRRAHPVENGAVWFGIKIHARNLPLVADLEMHVLKNGYVGLCRLPGDEVNVCGLFRRRSRRCKEVDSSCLPLPIPASSSLHQRLSAADLDQSSFCSIAGLCLKPQRASSLPEVSLGDALTMIPPVTGNGMSMAFEAAELAIEPLAGYSQGDLSWSCAQQQIARACDSQFASRLRWAQWLQWMMFSPLFQNHLGSLAVRSQFAWNILFHHTR
jgi:2-polyprenyl-6-methoxyphenol hydroxylase-like FAD-dependent oxidoreductase